ncbi:MAG: 50S ribosomal protein L9, partial [Polyangiaceae bacterium]
PGYARNFLIPRGLAAMATKDNVKRIEHEKRVALAKATKQRGAAEELAAKLASIRLQLTAQVGEEGKLYGSITSRDIEEALTKQGFDIDRRRIVAEPIKELGEFDIAVKLGAGVEGTFKLEVVAQEG